MKILVAYASRHGSTAGIAERIATRLTEAGLDSDLCDVEDVETVDSYDAFVIGSAAYMFHWLKPATAFVKKHHAHLAEHPAWLFSSGPLGTDLVDEEGRDILEVTRPKEWGELVPMINPRGDMVFFGAWDPEAPAIGMGERFLKLMPAQKDALPAGDFRDWQAIDEWAGEIAGKLLAEG